MTTPGTTSTTAATGTAAAGSAVLGPDPTRTSTAPSAPTEETAAAAPDAVDAVDAAEPTDTVRAYRDSDGRVHYASPHSKATRNHLATEEWTEIEAAEPPFDPTGQLVRDVVAYLEANADDQAEVDRVKAAEAAGENRPTIAAWSPDDGE